MIDETKQKILDAALKEFAEKGYAGATTMNIAEKAGFSEKTLFRKFKTKKNLFNQVIAQNNEKLMEDFNLLLVDGEFETPHAFLEVLIKNLAGLVDDHFEFVNLTLNETRMMPEDLAPEMIPFLLGKYMENNIKNHEIDYHIFAITILSFLTSIMNDKHTGINFVDYDDAIKKFTSNLTLCIK